MVMVVHSSSSFMQKSSKNLPWVSQAMNIWWHHVAPIVTPRFLQMHSDTWHAADLIWHSMAPTLARKVTLMNGWSLLCTRPKAAE